MSSEAFWDAIKPNLTKLADAAELARLVTGPVTPVIEEPALAAKAAALLPPEPWDEETWGAWTKAVAAETGAKGRALFHPLRLALTGLGAWTRTQKTVTPDRARPGLWRGWKEKPRDANLSEFAVVITRISICG